MNFVTWDLETSNLDADFGVILCSCIKPLGKRVETLRIDDYAKYKKDKTDYSGLAEDLRDRLNEVDGIITYYGQRFDMAFLKSAYIAYDITPHRPVFHADLWFISRYKFKLHNNRLVTVIDYLDNGKRGLFTKKTPLRGLDWKKATTGDKKALDNVAQHCRADVEALEQVYEVYKPYINRLERRP